MKKIIIFFGMLLSLLFTTGCSNSSDIIGNTNDEIIRFIHENDFMNNIGENNLTIIDTIYINNSKIAVFLSDTGQGYAVYEKNKKGDYILTENRAQGITSEGFGVTNFMVRYNSNNKLEDSQWAYLVISNGDNVSNVEMLINNHAFNKSMKIGEPSMVLLSDTLSESESKEMVSFDCRYFDINNNELISE